MDKANARRSRLQIIGTVVSIVLVTWLLARQDWRELLRLSGSLPLRTLLLALTLLYARMLFHTVRWTVLLRAQSVELGLGRALRLQMAGLFTSNFLPSTIGGDVARFAGIVPDLSNRVVAAASIAVDRAMGVVGMAFVLPVSWPLISGFIDGLAGGVSFAQFVLPERVRNAARRLREAMSLWAQQPSSLVAALLASWAGILSYLVSVLLVARGLHIPVGLADVAGATALTYFLTLVPLSINAYGIRELGILALYGQLGASPEQAAALALITRSLMVIASLPGAFGLGSVLRARRVVEPADG